MPQMFRRFSLFLIALAVLIAVEPLLHNHPLQQNGIPAACAICATGTTPLPLVAPTVSAPQIVAYTLLSAAVTIVTSSVVLSLPSRAPPAL